MVQVDLPTLLTSTTIECGRPGCKYNHDNSATIKNAIDKYLARAAKVFALILGRVLNNEIQVKSIKSTQAIQDIDIISHQIPNV